MRFNNWKTWSSQNLSEDHQRIMEKVMGKDSDWEAIEHQMRTTFNIVPYNKLKWNPNLDFNTR